MQVILLERVGRLGSIGDEVQVKNGFARNFLLRQGKALRANAANRARFEAERSVIEARNAEQRETAQAVAGSIDGMKITVIRQAGEGGQLYGSVTSRDIADALTAKGTEVARSQVDLNRPIKAVGLHEVTIRLHAEVESVVVVNVARSADEAERQAAGEDMTVVSYEEEPTAPPPAVEDVFEEGAAAEAAGEFAEVEPEAQDTEGEADAESVDAESEDLDKA
ncbi:MAG TPA: 50S ribosomal protein L9 [Devosiaceae bacterium]|nr:50S ribosomal protein L9 [Devosiaceae bacterium]